MTRARSETITEGTSECRIAIDSWVERAVVKGAGSRAAVPVSSGRSSGEPSAIALR
ncbi:hypothetical protein P3T37_006079 [Kitasatospora sp. MAA4]|uniref:hypothetical protein n=1 Tax=Kitasatospora sp. MAA4 TaxID=3035093 RepID=UPI0024754725|nr:hypothetical protein [Kitasatospora sp. MAA4]MDH6136648.1 hypothetical protein [Kitasatospora sp. MAA4]